MKAAKSFVCRPEAATYVSDDFKIYACEVREDMYPDIKPNVYGSVTIKGSFGELTTGADYEVTAVEMFDPRYKYSYQVQFIQPKKLETADDAKTFLSTIISEKKAENLLRVYPDIIERIVAGKPVDLSLVKGIKQKTFDKLRQKVISHYSMYGAITEFSGIFTAGVLKKLMDVYGSTARIKEELIYDPYRCLMALPGVGYKRVENILATKTEALEALLGRDYLSELRVSGKRLMACANDVLADNETDGSTLISVDDLYRGCEERCNEAIGHFKEIYSDPRFVFVGEDMVMRQEAFCAEDGIVRQLKALRESENDWVIDPEPYRQVDDITLTDDQFSMLRLILNNNIVILNGYAGAGKTQSTRGLIHMLRDNNKSFVCLAPTGRAAKVLSGYTGEEAMTIHRALGYRGEWDPLARIDTDIVILDEVSMVDIYAFYHLLMAIDPIKTKVLLIGDDAQLASVGCGNVLHDLLGSGAFATVTLDKIFRYGRGGLSTVATDIRRGKQYLRGIAPGEVKMVGSDNSYGFIQVDNNDIVATATNMYVKLLTSGYSIDDICVLSAFNTGNIGTVEINRSIQAAVNHSKEEYSTGDKLFRVGDPVINTKNNYHARSYDSKFSYIGEDFIANGEIGRVALIDNKSLYVAFGDKMILYTSFENLLLAYAISCHKSQGGSFRAVILSTPQRHQRMLTSNLLYVGVTRASEKCYHIGDAGVVNDAVKISEQINRKTFMKIVLNDFIKRY